MRLGNCRTSPRPRQRDVRTECAIGLRFPAEAAQPRSNRLSQRVERETLRSQGNKHACPPQNFNAIQGDSKLGSVGRIQCVRNGAGALFEYLAQKVQCDVKLITRSPAETRLRPAPLHPARQSGARFIRKRQRDK